MVHDTYYVVGHASYFMSMLIATAGLVLLWLLIARLAPGAFVAMRRTAAGLWITGAALMLLAPMLVASLPPDSFTSRPGLFMWFNAAAALGALLAFAALILTLLLTVLAILRRIRAPR